MKFLWVLLLLLSAGGGWVFGAEARIEDCRELDSFRAAPYLDVAVALQALPREEALAKLQAWADSREYDEQVIVLCRMLFEAEPGEEFRRPRLGQPVFYGGTSMEDWPLEPITIVDGVPLKIVMSYALAGVAEPAPKYLRYCLESANWTTFRYEAPTKSRIENALATLLESPKWQRPLKDWEIQRLKEQVLDGEEPKEAR